MKDNSSINLDTINPFRYRGYYSDEETSLYYLNSRYYNPTGGRFINAEGTLINGTMSYIIGGSEANATINSAWKKPQSLEGLKNGNYAKKLTKNMVNDSINTMKINKTFKEVSQTPKVQAQKTTSNRFVTKGNTCPITRPKLIRI